MVRLTCLRALALLRRHDDRLVNLAIKEKGQRWRGTETSEKLSTTGQLPPSDDRLDFPPYQPQYFPQFYISLIIFLGGVTSALEARHHQPRSFSLALISLAQYTLSHTESFAYFSVLILYTNDIFAPTMLPPLRSLAASTWCYTPSHQPPSPSAQRPHELPRQALRGEHAGSAGRSRRQAVEAG